MARETVVEVIRLTNEKGDKGHEKWSQIEVTVRYREGGMNPLNTTETIRRGYVLAARIEDCQRFPDGDNTMVMKLTPLIGATFGTFLEEATRFSQKKLDALAASIKTSPFYARLIAGTKDQFQAKGGVIEEVTQ